MKKDRVSRFSNGYVPTTSKSSSKDLYGRKASYHNSCQRQFNLKYSNFQRNKRQKNIGEAFSDSDAFSFAQIKAFNVLLAEINNKVI